MKRKFVLVLVTLMAVIMPLAAKIDLKARPGERRFIAHRGVDLKHTIAGENSIEAIGLAKRAGFQCIETDVRVTADDSLVVMHDATLNRTCTDREGNELKKEVAVCHVPWTSLRNDYRLKADDSSRRSQIPSLREYLTACRDAGILTFIEPKLDDETGNHYRRIMAVADEIMGRGNYIITSNNIANNVIRNTMLVKDVPLMGILYQTTFDKIEGLGNCIMAVSTSRFDDKAYDENIELSKSRGLACESHADNYPRFAMINRHELDYVSTDFLAPDYHGQGKLINTKNIKKIDKEFTPKLKHSDFGGLYVTMEIDGDAEVTMGGKTFKVAPTDRFIHQVVTYNQTPVFSVKPLSPTTVIKNLTLKQVEY